MPDSLDELRSSARGLGEVAGTAGDAFKVLGEHAKRFVDLLSDFELVDAAEEVPEAVKDEIETAATATGEAAHAVGHAAETVPAASEDVLDAGQSVTAPIRRKFRLRKKR